MIVRGVKPVCVDDVLTAYASTLGARYGFWSKASNSIKSPPKTAGILETNKKTIEKFLRGGHSAEELIQLIKNAYSSGSKATWLTEIFPQGATNGTNNLLTEEEIHPQVWVSVQAPHMVMKPDGSYERVNEIPNLIRKDYYTLENLLEYYYNKLRPEENQNRDIASLRWLMDKYGLDLVLYMIDVAHEAQEDGTNVQLDKGPIDLATWKYDAKERYMRRKGLGRIV